MSDAGRPIWFAGDPGDPLAAAIAAALPADRARWLHCPGDLPATWPRVDARSPGVVVLHRATLGGTDAARLAQLRAQLGPDRRVILCVGPHARHADVERWARWADVVLPEATAAETIARHVGPVEPAGPPPVEGGGGRRVAVAAGGTELRAAWAAILRAAGYDVAEVDRPEAAPRGLPTVWDVPVLEPGWADRLAARAATGPLIAAIGFLDRDGRDRARRAGAVACLDQPADLADLVRAVELAHAARRDPAHAGIPAPSRPPAPSTAGRRARRPR